MSKIKKLSIKNFLGLEELGLDCSKINLIKGPKGSGKSSIIEAIEKTFTNKNRRTEVIKHGQSEATLYIELDNGLEVDRRIRTEKADYLKVRKEDEAVPSTEKFLRSLINGDIFRPIDWVYMGIKEQTKSILNMLKIDWENEDIVKWFGEIPSNIDFNNHILQILKAIEMKYFKDREEVNRQIKELKTQVKVILDELPAEYCGDTWKDKKVQDYYNKVAEVQKINEWINSAKSLQNNYKRELVAINANADSEKTRIEMRFKDQGQDIKDIIELSKNKIEKSENFLSNIDNEKENIAISLCRDMEDEIREIKSKYAELEREKLKEVNSQVEDKKEFINIQNNKIALKNQELNSLDSLKKQELKAVDEKIVAEIEKEKIRVGKAVAYLEENEAVNIEPLQQEANEVAHMQSYLRQWDMMKNIKDKLTGIVKESKDLTTKISKARELPCDLLKTAEMPIDGISVDSRGFIRINNTLIDGLSDGEKLELAMRIAKAQAGELKVICLDKFESLNPAAQAKLLNEMTNDEYQYFVTSTMADGFEIEKIGS